MQPHPCIGRARRVVVGRRQQLAAAMVEAVQNHGPEVGELWGVQRRVEFTEHGTCRSWELCPYVQRALD